MTLSRFGNELRRAVIYARVHCATAAAVDLFSGLQRNKISRSNIIGVFAAGRDMTQ